MPKGYALALGLNSVDRNHYQGWSGQLNACEADAKSMLNIAKSKGYALDQLLTKDANRATFKMRMQIYADKLQTSDILMLSYSGHGSQLPDLNSDEIDKKDETWCLYDGQLVDDELYALLAKFKKGVRILIFSDSCHSGSVIKAMYHSGWSDKVVSHAMPSDLEQLVYYENKEFYDSILTSKELRASSATINASIILISGCQDNQVSADGKYNGLFTARMLDVWNKGRFFGNYTRFHKEIVNKMPPYQTPNLMLMGNQSFGFVNQPVFTI